MGKRAALPHWNPQAGSLDKDGAGGEHIDRGLLQKNAARVFPLDVLRGICARSNHAVMARKNAKADDGKREIAPDYNRKQGADQTMSSEKDKKKKKKEQSSLEAAILQIMEKSMKTALDMALDDIFKAWK